MRDIKKSVINACATLKLMQAYWAKLIAKIVMMLAICSFSFSALAEAVNSKPLYAQPIHLLNGQTVNLQSYVGQKPVYLKFWASWCQPCMQEMPHLQHAYEKYAEQIEFIAVNVNINETEQDIAAVIQRFGLTLPIALDENSALAHHYKMLGTPYHVLLNKQGKVVHTGNQANDKLDHKLQLLAADNGADIAITPLTDNSGHTTQLADIKQTAGLVYFTATWCDWYLAETRPDMSKACIEAQQETNRLQQAMPDLHWYGIVNHLWTSEEDLVVYTKKYQIKYPMAVDNGGDAFFSYSVHTVPSLIIFKDGIERYRTTDIVNNPQLAAAIQQWLMP